MLTKITILSELNVTQIEIREIMTLATKFSLVYVFK